MSLIKEEMSAAEAQLVGLVDQVDIGIVLKVVSLRLFDRFSIWDLMLAKARLNQDHGAMECIMNDTEALLAELKLMIESCLTPVKLNRWNKKYEYGKRKKPREATEDTIEVDDMLGLALALESGMWKKKELEENWEKNNDDYEYIIKDFLHCFLIPNIDKQKLRKRIVFVEKRFSHIIKEMNNKRFKDL